MKDCQICAQKPYLSFNWEYANEGKDKELARFTHHLQPVRPLKFGHLYQCPINQNYWYLDDDGSFIYSVPLDKVELLWQWNNRSLVLTDAQIKILAKIGATESDRFGNGKGEIKIPCRIQRTQDEVYDPALVIVTKMPPIQKWQKRVLLGNSDDVVEQSDLALPLHVRIATLNADEINMGFAPTLVKSIDDEFFVLNWATQIFSYGRLKGKDISLSDKPFRRGYNFPIINEDPNQITFSYYDWYAGCQKLIRKSAG